MGSPKKNFTIIKDSIEDEYKIDKTKKSDFFDMISKIFTDAMDNCKEVKMKKDKTLIYM